MDTARRHTRVLLALSLALLALPASARAEGQRAGVIAALEGTATVARAATPEAIPLRFKDDVFLQDRITTGEKSIVRVLLGGKATVTAREHSTLVINEVPGTAMIELASGRIAVAVSKDKMKPGEVVEIHTPNAIAAIRGTIVVAEVSADRSAITVLRGLIDVTRIDPATGLRSGPAVPVSVRETIAVIGSAPTPLPRPASITPDRARRLSADFTVLPKKAPAATVAPVVRAAMDRAAQDLAAVLPKNGDGESAGRPEADSRSGMTTGSTTGSTLVDGVTLSSSSVASVGSLAGATTSTTFSLLSGAGGATTLTSGGLTSGSRSSNSGPGSLSSGSGNLLNGLSNSGPGSLGSGH